MIKIIFLTAALIASHNCQQGYDILYTSDKVTYMGILTPMNRFEAVDKCRDDLLGRMTGSRSSQLNARAKSWIASKLTDKSLITDLDPKQAVYGLNFHLDVYNDSSSGVS